VVNSTVKRPKNKPNKPYPDFPLYAHATGRWAKKVKGKLHYFGSWDDPQSALQKWIEQRDDLLAGRTPRVTSDGLTIRDVCNRYLTAKRHLLDTEELTARSFQDYYTTCERTISAFGRNRVIDDLVADDFRALRVTLSKTRGPVALGNEIQRVRMVFKFAYDEGLIDKPIRYGQAFDKPSKKILRQHRQKKQAENGKRMFEAKELCTIIDAASQPLKTMILLAINGGFGQSDLSQLPKSAIDLDSGFIDYPRPKTAVERRCPLWPETIAALKAAMADRPTPKDEADNNLVFVTKYGNRWVKANSTTMRDDAVGKEFSKLLRSLGLKRAGLNFYAIRHTFQTVAENSRDFPAVKHVMGHTDDSMSSIYREGISDERLIAVTDTVHRWLFPAEDDGGPE